MSAKKGFGAETYIEKYRELGSVSAVARYFGVHRSGVQRAMRAAGFSTDVDALLGALGGVKTVKYPLPKAGEVKRYIVTAAQNNTAVNKTFFDRLMQLRDFYKAQLLVCPFTYSPKTSLTAIEDPWYDPQVQEHLVTDRIQLANGLILCAEVTRTLPTAARPLSGYETYTGRASSIFPHAKIAMESVPSMRNEGTKLMYTTGACTKHNYSRTKAGFKGEFHHAYGALIVEVMRDGWWVRQINADSQNRIYDLDVCVDDEGVTYGNAAEALAYGDLHPRVADPDVVHATWGPGGLADFLQPAQQIVHDGFDMESRAYQDEASFHRQYQKYVQRRDSVQDEVDHARRMVLDAVIGDRDCKTVFVRSNHDLKLEKWLDRGEYRTDHANAEFFLEAQLAKVKAIKRGDTKFKVLEWALKHNADAADMDKLSKIVFLDEDESYVICRNRGGGIECGNHGHLGPNGSHGTPRGLAKMARKQIIGDKHSAGIYDGVYVVGTCTGPDVAYAKGPSSWSPTHCVVYENGKRALVTMWNRRFFAPRDGLTA